MELDKILKAFKSTSKKSGFPGEALDAAIAKRDIVTPYLLDSLDNAKANVERWMKEDEYDDTIVYALFLLAELRETGAYRRLTALLSLNSEQSDFLLEDIITDDVPAILSSVYDGDPEPLNEIIFNKELDPFVRDSALRGYSLLYLRRLIPREVLTDMIGRIIDTEKDGDTDQTFLTLTVSASAELHFYEYAPAVRRLFDDDLLDETLFGNYANYIDILYSEEKFSDKLTIDDAKAELRKFVCFKNDKRELEKIKRIAARLNGTNKTAAAKPERNDPCPCGSGKKYKKCCMQRDEEENSAVKQYEKALLSDYPKPGTRFYSDFSKEALDFDLIAYKAVGSSYMTQFVGAPDELYIYKNKLAAYDEFMRLYKACGSDTAAFNVKYTVHYNSEEFLTTLFDYFIEWLDKHHYDERAEDIVEEISDIVDVDSDDLDDEDEDVFSDGGMTLQ